MTGELVETKSWVLENHSSATGMPALIVCAGGDAEKRFLDLFEYSQLI